MEKHTATFTAHTQDDQPVVIHQFTKMVNVDGMGDPNAVIPGMKRLCTEDGDSVNSIEKRKYEIVQTGVVVTSDDPSAP